jgi:hypothetical protein
VDWDLLVPIAGIAAGLVVVLPIVRVIVRAIDRRTAGVSPGPAVASEDLAEVRGQLEELREVAARVDELEERMDFAERMLASAKRERLGAGGEAER